jgi:hypothetical protein
MRELALTTPNRIPWKSASAMQSCPSRHDTPMTRAIDLTADAFPPSAVSSIPGTNPDNPFPWSLPK